MAISWVPNDSWLGLPGAPGWGRMSGINTPSHKSVLSCKLVHLGSKVWIWTVDEKLTTGVDNGKETVKA
jgi:hypothetical protein